MRDEDKKSLIIDLDGTLCHLKRENEGYQDVLPVYEVIEKMHEWKKNGFKIIIYTARNMRTFNGNLGLINVHTATIIIEWLDKHNVPYDEILYGKPWPGHRGYYIDDRAIRPREFVENSESELDHIIKKDRFEC
jgi:capsule biosynthesis phosphatase